MPDDVAIRVNSVSKTFILPHEKQSSVKGALISVIRGGSRSYEKQRVLKEVSFEVKKGEFFGIVGRNGSGKSTLLKMLAGIYTPTAGSIDINGKLTPFIELGVGFNPELTGRENVFLNGALLGFSRAEMNQMYDDIVAFSEIEKFMDQKLKNYSSGMQVRLAFSIAIRANTDILVLDEVLAVGDAAFQQKCFDYFERLKKEKKTIVIVTHDMAAVKRFCSRAILIEDGEIKVSGSPDDVANQYIFDNLNTGEDGKTVENEQLTPALKSLNLKMLSPSKIHTSERVEFYVTYELTKDVPVYLALSVMFQGISIIEHNSKNTKIDHTPNKKHTVRYSFPASGFNTDSFKINISMFKESNAQLLGYKADACNFFVKSDDPTKGGPIATTGTWESLD